MYCAFFRFQHDNFSVFYVFFDIFASRFLEAHCPPFPCPGTTAGLLHLWRVADGHLHCTVPAHDQPILALAATVAGRVVSAGNDMVAKVCLDFTRLTRTV